MNHQRYRYSSERLDVITEQLELIFTEVEALTDTFYVVEHAEEDVITHQSEKRKREADLKNLLVEAILHTLPE